MNILLEKSEKLQKALRKIYEWNANNKGIKG